MLVWNKIISKFRKRKFNLGKLSNEEKVKHFSEKAVGLFDHIHKTNEELIIINDELQAIIQSEDQEIEREIERHKVELQKRLKNKVRAMDEIGMNTKVQEKLADFIR